MFILIGPTYLVLILRIVVTFPVTLKDTIIFIYDCVIFTGIMYCTGSNEGYEIPRHRLK